ncbi:MAG: ROK family protein [Gorillibacterium sp.]|nr:ROK family protein [Gorillibacterium sp.]
MSDLNRHKAAIVLDFGGTTIKLGLIQQGHLLAQSTVPARSVGGLLPRLGDVRNAVLDLLGQAGLSLGDCFGVGIALPGIVDPERFTLLSINEKYADAIGFAFNTWAEEAFGLPIVMENDARAALLGEISYGTAKGESNAVLMIFGTGIGTAAIMNGKIVRGRHLQAGILGGHFVTDVNGSICNCGNIGCIEAQASHWSIQGWLSKQAGYANSILAKEPEMGYRQVIEASQTGDPLAVFAMQHLYKHWTSGIVNLIHAYDPEVVILSGGLMKSKDIVLPVLTQRVLEQAWTPWGQVRFLVAEDPNASVLLGLSHLLERGNKYDFV